MSTQARKIYTKAFWSIIILLSAYYLYRAIDFRFYREGLGPTFWNKQFLYIFHIATALAPLILGPIQFWNGFRIRYMNLHRTLGKVYIIGSLLGGVSAFVLGITQPYEGSIIPVMLLSILWIFMTIAAWITIRRKNIKAHRHFMIRSYTLGLTFIALRILDDLVYKQNLLFFITNDEVKDTTYEWMSWVLPLLVVEFFISWIPAIRQKKSVPNR